MMLKGKVALLILFAVLIGGVLLGIYLIDKAIYYRDYIQFIEGSPLNQGLHLATPGAIKAAELDHLGVLIGGSLPRLWFLPKGLPYPLANLSGLEEPIETTMARFDENVIGSGAEFVVVNAGFCNLFGTIQSGGNPAPVIEKILDVYRAMLQKAQAHGVQFILSTLNPVRPRFLLAHLGIIDYSRRFKDEENAAYQTLNARIRAFCEKERLPLIDFHSVLADEKGELIRDYSLPDGEHLNVMGYQRLSDFLASELKRIFPLENPAR